MLRVEHLTTGYGKRRIVSDVSFSVETGRIAALIGHNGSGKSTILKSLFGLLPIWSGEVNVDGTLADRWTSTRAVNEGVAYVPQGENVFDELTVQENLEIGFAAIRQRTQGKTRFEEVLKDFPDLRYRLPAKARHLSGGQKQMLAIGRALMIDPKLLLLDEPSAGLAPRLVAELFTKLQETARDRRLTVLVVEQKVREVVKFADVCGVLRNGRLSFWGDATELSDERRLKEVYL